MKTLAADKDDLHAGEKSAPAAAGDATVAPEAYLEQLQQLAELKKSAVALLAEGVDIGQLRLADLIAVDTQRGISASGKVTPRYRVGRSSRAQLQAAATRELHGMSARPPPAPPSHEPSPPPGWRRSQSDSARWTA